MAKSPYTSRKLLNELKRLEKESEDMMLTHNLHDIAINGKRLVVLDTLRTSSTSAAFM